MFTNIVMAGFSCCLSVVFLLSVDILNVFPSETTGPIKTKYYMDPPWDRETNVCTIYSKNPLNVFFSGTNGPIALPFLRSIRNSGAEKVFISIMIPG